MSRALLPRVVKINHLIIKTHGGLISGRASTYGTRVSVCVIIFCVHACGLRLINWEEVADWLRVGSGAGGVSAALDLASCWIRVCQGD